MVRECSALELRARLVLLAAPDGVLNEGALGKAIGRTTRAARDALLAKLTTDAIVVVEPARTGRRIRLVDRGRALTGDLHAPVRARFSGGVVNALLARLSQAEAPASPERPAAVPGGSHSLRECVLAVHERLARGPGGTLELAALRAALPDVATAELDRVLVELDRAGVVALGRPVDLASLDARTRGAAIEDAHRGALVYVSRTKANAEAKP